MKKKTASANLQQQ